jgi:hypothetical protein
MQTNQLTEAEFKATLEQMTDITDDGDATVDIWDYVQQLVAQGLVPQFVFDETTVEYVYRNESETFDHVVITGWATGAYVVIVVDLTNECIYGHYPVDVASEYQTE